MSKLSDSVPIFFAKPSCITNRKQKAILREAGIEFVEQNLLSYPWTEQILLKFFVGLPKSLWINKSAPKIKNGEVVPEQLTESQLLAMMVQDPVLIRRPLLCWRGQHWAGFDWPMLRKVLPSAVAEPKTMADKTRSEGIEVVEGVEESQDMAGQQARAHKSVQENTAVKGVGPDEPTVVDHDLEACSKR